MSTTIDAPTAATPVPFLDLKAQYLTIKPDIHAALDQVMNTSSFILGPSVQGFERDFAKWCGASECVGLNSGTSALHLAMECLNIGPGDEVILPAMSFIATAWPVAYLGATPVFVDVDPQRYTLDPKLIAAAITPRTKAIVPVHLYGQCAEMDAILKVARAHRIPVIEDAAQAHGAVYKGQRAGTLGDIACFSFYPGKNLGAYGEGGAVVTNNPEFAARCRTLRDHGQKERYVHESLGYNFRMDGFQGAVLGVKLKHLDAWTAARQAAAARYDALLAEMLPGDSGVIAPRPCPDGRHVYHLYVIRHAKRDALRDALNARQIQSGLHYPIPIHMQKPFQKFARPLPVTEEIARTCISLPMFPELTEQQQRAVVTAVRDFARG